MHPFLILIAAMLFVVWYAASVVPPAPTWVRAMCAGMPDQYPSMSGCLTAARRAGAY
jgi:hypothetical protein